MSKLLNRACRQRHSFSVHYFELTCQYSVCLLWSFRVMHVINDGIISNVPFRKLIIFIADISFVCMFANIRLQSLLCLYFL